VFATGETYSVREFAQAAFDEAGFSLYRTGDGSSGQGLARTADRVVIEIDPRNIRPTEADILQADASRARDILGWEPKAGFCELVAELVGGDFKAVAQEISLREPRLIDKPLIAALRGRQGKTRRFLRRSHLAQRWP